MEVGQLSLQLLVEGGVARDVPRTPGTRTKVLHGLRHTYNKHLRWDGHTISHRDREVTKWKIESSPLSIPTVPVSFQLKLDPLESPMNLL